jgi:maltose alpha-D-glucosyltransferase/alpha-amylase
VASPRPTRTNLPGPIPDGRYGPEQVNVAAQERDPDSLLSWIRQLIQRYRECPELAWGRYTVLDTGEPSVLAHRCDIDGTVIALHNLADRDVTPRLVLDNLDGSHVLTDLLHDGRTDVLDDGTVTLRLGPYGCRWLRASQR